MKLTVTKLKAISHFSKNNFQNIILKETFPTLYLQNRHIVNREINVYRVTIHLIPFGEKLSYTLSNLVKHIKILAFK